MEALVRHGSAVAQSLIDQLQGDDDTRLAAVMALGRLGDPRATEPSRACSRGIRIVAAAAGALASIGDARAFEPLLALLGHPDATVRQATIGGTQFTRTP